MTRSSSIAPAEDAILAALQAQALVPGSALKDVPIQLGNPGAGKLNEHVWIGEHVIADQVWDSTGDVNVGNQLKEETIHLPISVWVSQSGDDFKGIRDRVDAMVEEVLHVFRTNITLGAAVFEARVVQLERQSGADQAGREMECMIHLDITAFPGAA